MSLQEKVKKYIQDNKLIKKGDFIIIGISGGADSMALAHILYQLRYSLGFGMHLAHFNHNLRRSSIKDKKCVEQFAVRYNLNLSTDTWQNPPKINSIEEKARIKRISFFTKVIKKNKANSIALAHHKNDISETMLMRLTRGTGINGLRGILPDRIIDGNRVIRPLLNTTKDEIINYLHDKKISYCEDPTNKNQKFLRNKTRHQLLPLLKNEYNNGIVHNLYNLSQVLTTDYDFLEEHCRKLYKKTAQPSKSSIKFSLNTLVKKHTSERRMLYRYAFEALSGSTNTLTYKHIDIIDQVATNKEVASKINITKRITITRTVKYLTFHIIN